MAEERWSPTTIRMLSLKERSRLKGQRELPLLIVRIAAVVTFGNAEAGLIDWIIEPLLFRYVLLGAVPSDRVRNQSRCAIGIGSRLSCCHHMRSSPYRWSS